MRRKFWLKSIPVVVILSMICLLAPVLGQKQDIKTQLFEDANQALKKARDEQAEILAPVNFMKGLENHNQAWDDYEKGKSLNDIRKKLNEAVMYFDRAFEATQLAKVTFAKALAARSDAGEADAKKYAEKTWIIAEEKLLDGTRKLERGDAKAARNVAGEAETLYRQAELDAIKFNYLQATWELLDQAEKSDARKKAPNTLQRAKNLVQRSENILNTDRYNTDEARQLAQEAKTEVEHAFWLTETITKIEKDKNTFENILLSSEANFNDILDLFDLAPKFNRGPKPIVEQIVEKITELQRLNQTQKQELIDKDEQIKAVMSELKTMEERLGTLSIEKKTYEARLERQRIEKEKFDRIEKLFLPQEAQVLREGNKLIIRFWGLNFPSGRADLQPAHYGMLSKLKDVMKEYPETEVEIQGHTDSRGGDELNQRLSTERAFAVKEYLIANNIVTENKSLAIGYGETMPIANNETETGRTKNRRTDIILKIPEKEIQ